jgi:hypothetical protein
MAFGFMLQDGSNLVLQDGGSVLLLEQTADAMATARGRDIRKAIRDLLFATGEFDGVYMSGPFGSFDRTQCWVFPAKDSLDIDEDYGGMVLIRSETELHFAATDYDPDVADQAVDRMLSIACNALNGQSLAGVTFPAFTRITKTKWIDKPPVRRIATLAYAYMVDSWDGFNTDE